MRAGLLKYRVTIQSRLQEQDPKYGGQVNAWDDVATVWAGITPLRGRELFAAQAIHSKAEVKILIRYRGDLSHDMRVKHGDIIYDIHSIPPVPDRYQGLTLLCSTGVTEG